VKISAKTPFSRILYSSRILLLLALVGLCSASASALTSRRTPLDPCEVSATAGPSVPEPFLPVKQACSLIKEGKFAEAAKLIEQAAPPPGPAHQALQQLAQIVRRYEQIQQQRQAARREAYEQQLKKLRAFKFVDPSQNSVSTSDINDVNTVDLNDANDIRKVFSVIASAREFADEDQKQKLLEDPLVQKVIRKAIDKAAELESRGKWLEAYTNCYGWLVAVDPNNQAYSDYAEELLEKAEIAASFEDSPCETSHERYEGIRKEMFIRAVHVLSLDYVGIIDYRQMAKKAIDRCRMLAEVINTRYCSALASAEDTKDPNAGDDPSQPGSAGANGVKISFTPPNKDQLAAWSAALAAVRDQIDQALAEFRKDDFLKVFDKVLALNKTTVDLPESMMIAHFAQAALAALDRYTQMVWPKQVQDFEKLMTNEFTGIGVEITKRTGQLTVASLLPDTPAYRAGLDAGDIIEAVDGVPTKDMSLICAVHKITGPKGTKVTLTIRRPSEQQSRTVTIIRDKIIIPTIRGWQRTAEGNWRYMIDPNNKIGYIRIMSFSAETPDHLERVLDQLESEGMQALIIDLRGNPGGLLDSAVKVADKFIEKGLIVRTQPGPGLGRWPTYATADPADTHPPYPLVVLIDSGSASGSEILAGALADPLYERATLVGTRTHGKGSVQTATGYPGGGAQLKYTMAYYHLPSGQRVESKDQAEKKGKDSWGVEPDVRIALRSDELRKLIDLQRDNDVLVQAERSATHTELKKHSLQETLEADPQLAVALLVAEAKLIESRIPSQTDTK